VIIKERTPALLRISLSWIVHAIASIDRLQQITPGQKVQDIWYLCFDAQQNVELLFNNSVYSPHLKTSREKSSLLNTTLGAMAPTSTDQQREVTQLDVWMIKYHGNQLKDILMAELNILPTFLVAEKEGYDINALIDNGYKLFPPTTLSKCPEAENDMVAAGKALAFELPVACGFHVFRATEAVLTRYWNYVSGGQSPKGSKTIGNYATQLEKGNLGDKKIWEALKQLSKLHRNPVIHPEVVLTVEEAIETLGIARSVMGAMVRVLPDIPPATGSSANP
jgi:hypothetical protein